MITYTIIKWGTIYTVSFDKISENICELSLNSSLSGSFQGWNFVNSVKEAMYN